MTIKTIGIPWVTLSHHGVEPTMTCVCVFVTCADSLLCKRIVKLTTANHRRSDQKARSVAPPKPVFCCSRVVCVRLVITPAWVVVGLGIVLLL